MNIRTRFALAGVVSTCVVLLGAGGVIVRQSSMELRQNFDSDLTARFQATAPVIASSPSIERLIDTLSANSTESGVRVLRNGTETRIGSMPLNPPVMDDKKLTTIRSNGDTWRAYSGAITVDSSISAQPVTVQMFAPVDTLNQRVNVIRQRVAEVLGISIVVTAILSWIVGGYAANPLRRLAGAVRTYKEGEIPTKQGVDEVDAVAKTITQLLEQLQQEHDQTRTALLSAREFSWNAVHELRTPLMSMRTDTDALRTHPNIDDETRAQLLAGIARQHDRINATLTALHDLARGELQSKDTMQEVDLCEIAENVIEGLRSVYPAAHIDMESPQSVHVKGWQEGLEIAIRNLVLNAIKHGKTEPHVHVEIREDATVIVDDDGPGIPESERNRVFERFVRTANTSAGIGLGLALVRQQAELHGGSAAIDNSPLGGTRVVLSMNKETGENS